MMQALAAQARGYCGIISARLVLSDIALIMSISLRHYSARLIHLQRLSQLAHFHILKSLIVPPSLDRKVTIALLWNDPLLILLSSYSRRQSY